MSIFEGPNKKPVWRELKQHWKQISQLHMRHLFDSDPARASQFSIEACGLSLDYSKNRITQETMALLMELADNMQVEQWRDWMFSGEPINSTEKRAVLHTALRNQNATPIMVDGVDVMKDIHSVLNRMRVFSEDVRSGKWLGYTGKPITDVVNVGIGGSDLGAAMVCEALKPYAHDYICMHFVSNVDGAHVQEVLQGLNPATTLFVISSKTFTTLETMANAHSARHWFLASGAEKQDIAKHFVAASVNEEKVVEFGIDPANMFEFWDWVGGRYSLWSAIGLPIVLYIGMYNFKKMLKGAYQMDEHFQTAPLQKNMPVIMAMLGIWYADFFGATSYAMLPYDQSLLHLPRFLQQLDMESNGKHIDRNGEIVGYNTAPIIWGEPGTNGQHSFFQLLHQGTWLVPADFMAPIHSHFAYGEHHDILLANMLAQTSSLMQGRSLEEARETIAEANIDQDDLSRRLPHLVFAGNHPSNTLLFEKLTPRTLGSIIALYEHKTFVQGVVWNLNSFDQWGVELGKQITKDLLHDLQNPNADSVPESDSSTEQLMNQIKGSRIG